MTIEEDRPAYPRVGRSLLEPLKYDAMMNKHVVYTDLAEFYDLFYTTKDYKREAIIVEAIIAKYKATHGNALLDVACGTGKHLEHFTNNFTCTGMDVNKEIIEVAEKRLKNVVFEKMDMVSFHSDKQYDVITCLFGSIAYVMTYKNLNSTICNFTRHLKKGGVVIIEPWLTKTSYKAGSSFVKHVENDNAKVVRLTSYKAKGGIARIDMHFLIAETGKEVQHRVDRHDLGLFETDRTLRFMRNAGLKSRLIRKTFPVLHLNGSKIDRGLLVGVKECP